MPSLSINYSLFLILAFFFALNTIPAQERKVIELDFETMPDHILQSNLQTEGPYIGIFNHQQAGRFFSSQLVLPEFREAPFIAFSAAWKGKNLASDQLRLMIITSTDGQTWTNWIPVDLENHFEQSARKELSRLYFLDKESRYFRYYLRFEKGTEARLSKLDFHFYNPGETKNTRSKEEEAPQKTTGACPCPQPDFEGRDDWCPAGDCPPSSSPATTPVSHLIVHHSATGNTASDWAAVVRSIWDHHVNTNGWGDIGYNWLIDPNGVLYEGRGEDILGAHFCGTNFGTMGVCMIGTYTSVPPSVPAQNKLVEFLSWNSCDEDLDPLGQSLHISSGLSLHHISGHRDGCATECPGESFYALFDGLREEVTAFIEMNCTEGLPDLVIDDMLTSPNQVEAGIEVDIVAKVKNVGAVNASMVFVAHYLDDSLQESDTISSLSAGQFAFTTLSDHIFDYGGDYEYCAKITYAFEEADSTNNTDCLEIHVDGMTNNKEANRFENQFRIFPNPANGLFTIESEPGTAFSISVFDANGRMVYEMEKVAGSGPKLDLSHLPDGIYMVKLFNNEQIEFKKVLMQK